MCFRLLLPPFVIIFDIIPRSVGVSENVFSFTPPSLRNYSKFAAEIWRKYQESLFLFGILYFKVNSIFLPDKMFFCGLHKVRIFQGLCNVISWGILYEYQIRIEDIFYGIFPSADPDKPWR